MLTGDNKKSAENIARKLNIDNVIAEVLPTDKANKIKLLQSPNKVVAMVGLLKIANLENFRSLFKSTLFQIFFLYHQRISARIWSARE